MKNYKINFIISLMLGFSLTGNVHFLLVQHYQEYIARSRPIGSTISRFRSNHPSTRNCLCDKSLVDSEQSFQPSNSSNAPFASFKPIFENNLPAGEKFSNRIEELHKNPVNFQIEVFNIQIFFENINKMEISSKLGHSDYIFIYCKIKIAK